MSVFYIPTEEWLGFHFFLSEKHPELKPNTPVEEMKLLWNEYVYAKQNLLTQTEEA
jgi:hypothetical protein